MAAVAVVLGAIASYLYAVWALAQAIAALLVAVN
jgi:hypothetical protein